jgi:CPA1 family monovalent cation:H+ antiporter
MAVKKSATFMILEFLTPFICYLLAETIGVSGIIAAVTAGIQQAFAFRHVELFEAEFSAFKRSMWDMLTTTFNSLVFLLLGFQLPTIVQNIIDENEHSLSYAFGIGALATAILFIVRFAGVFFLAAPAASGNLRERMKNSLILTLSGVKGTVSLATAFSLPYYIASNGEFYQRSLLLFVTATTIILSLISAVTILPFVAQKNTISRKNAHHIAVLNEVLAKLSERDGAYTVAVIVHFKRRIKDLMHADLERKEQRRLAQLRTYVLKLEKDMVEKQRADGTLTNKEATVYLSILLTMSNRTGRMNLRRLHIKPKTLYALGIEGNLKGLFESVATEKMQEVFWQNTSNVIEALESKRDDDKDVIVSELIDERIDLMGQIFEGTYGEAARARLHDKYDEEMMKGFEIERSVVDKFQQRGFITNDEADNMRINVNTMETYLLEGRHNNNVMKLISKAEKKRYARRKKDDK